MEPWIRERMIWNVGFLVLTYVPLQAIALWRQRGANRIAAAVPMLFMVPMIIGASSADAYRDGSLFGMYYYIPYAPAMLYLAIAALSAPKSCRLCGQPIRRRSFRQTPQVCPRCADQESDTADAAR
jgi:hypothetical protein